MITGKICSNIPPAKIEFLFTQILENFISELYFWNDWPFGRLRVARVPEIAYSAKSK